MYRVLRVLTVLYSSRETFHVLIFHPEGGLSNSTIIRRSKTSCVSDFRETQDSHSVHNTNQVLQDHWATENPSIGVEQHM